jgi:hypothetical protein
VKLTSGKWYYEVKILSYGQYQIGWCGSNYKKVNIPKQKVTEIKNNFDFKNINFQIANVQTTNFD